MMNETTSNLFSTENLTTSTSGGFAPPPPGATPVSVVQVPGWLQWTAGSQQLSLAIAEVIGVPSTLLYFTELVVMAVNWKEKFSSAFYYFFVFRGISDLICTVNTYLNSRLGLWGIGLGVYQRLPTVVLNALYMSNFFTYGMSNLATAIMSLNRLTAVSIPMRHQQLWRKATPWAIGLAIALPFLYTVHILWLHCFIVVGTSNPQTWSINNWERINGTELINDLFVASVSGQFYMLLTLGINIALICKLKHQHQLDSQMTTNNDREADQRRELEHRLTVYTLTTFVGHFVHSSYIFIKYMVFYQLPKWNAGFDAALVGPLSQTMLNVQNIVGDFDNVALPSWVMLWANRELRELMKHYFWGRPKALLGFHNGFTSSMTVSVLNPSALVISGVGGGQIRPSTADRLFQRSNARVHPGPLRTLTEQHINVVGHNHRYA